MSDSNSPIVTLERSKYETEQRELQQLRDDRDDARRKAAIMSTGAVRPDAVDATVKLLGAASLRVGPDGTVTGASGEPIATVIEGFVKAHPYMQNPDAPTASTPGQRPPPAGASAHDLARNGAYQQSRDQATSQLVNALRAKFGADLRGGKR
jgi:hypothetical protein